MASGVVSIGRHRYAVGLYWENSPGKGRVAQIAKEAAAQPGQQADFYAVRPGSVKDGRIPQFGLCSGESGQTAGMPVLSACLAMQVPGSWAGAFRLHEGVVLVIVRDDLIVPDGDLFFQDEAEARDRLIQEIGFGGLQTIYAPESWSIPGADSIPLTLLLNDQAEIKLQRVSLPPKIKAVIFGGVVVLATVLGVIWYLQERDAEEQRLLLQRQEEAQRLLSGVPFGQRPQPEPKYVRTWEDAPRVIDVVNNCFDGLSLIPSALSGWTLSTMTCGGTSISLSWRRTGGSTVPPKGSSVDVSGQNATLSIPLKPLERRGAESLKNIDEITNRYLLQNWPGSLSRAPDDPPPSPPPDYKGPWNPPPAPWVKRSFTLTVSNLPGGVPGYIGDIPGAIVSLMNYSPTGGSSAWRIEGVIYENRK